MIVRRRRRASGWGTGPRRVVFTSGSSGTPTVTDMAEAFTLLMPVYRQDRPEMLRRAFTSTVHEQLRRPSEVVVVQDGAIGRELASALESLESTSPVPVRRLRLSRSVGLAQE